MAPEGSTRKPRENQYIFDLGVRGRKTGLTVADTGIRDENGLEPMDHLFSSPEKSTKPKGANGRGRNANGTISSEEDMDVDESTIPDPNAVLTARQQRASMRMPPPHSKSPMKTFLQSPARRNPSLGPLSSPSRRSDADLRAVGTSTSVRRRLDFSNDSLEASTADSPITSPPRKPGNSKARSAFGKLTNGIITAVQKRVSGSSVNAESADEEQDDAELGNEESLQIIDGGDDEELGSEAGEPQEMEEDEPEPESEPEPEPEPPKKIRGKGKAKESKAKEAEAAKIPAKKGRPKKNQDGGGSKKKRDSEQLAEQTEDAPPAKRTRRSLDAAEPAPKAAPKGKASKASKAAAAPKITKPKANAKKAKLAPIPEATSPEVQRGPPMPRNNRGLIILRRETPMEGNGNGFVQTRSGRNSIKPVGYWKNERIEYSEDEYEDMGRKFLLPRIKGVVRADEVEEPPKERRKNPHNKPRQGKKRAATVELEEEDDDDDEEPWETEPGRIMAEIRTWDPDDPTGVYSDAIDEEIALSSAAIVTRDIAGASFKFAKTLSLPFFGSGMVDLPPNSIKKPKNSRRMQMTFFVFYGRVEVTVNESTFRIGKGGMWQVPRGNFYSIANEYDKPARIFFSQGCEIREELLEPQVAEEVTGSQLLG